MVITHRIVFALCVLSALFFFAATMVIVLNDGYPCCCLCCCCNVGSATFSASFYGLAAAVFYATTVAGVNILQLNPLQDWSTYTFGYSFYAVLLATLLGYIFSFAYCCCFCSCCYHGY